MKNAKTQQEYTATNTSSLEESLVLNGFQSDEWATFLQWKELGFNVKKGEKSTQLCRVVYKKEISKTTGKEVKKKLLKRFNVFNRDQVEAGA